MKRFIEGADCGQSTMLPELLDDNVDEDNQVRVVDIFVDQLDLASLGFEPKQPAASVEPAPGARSAAERRIDVVDRTPDTGLQDDRKLQKRQW